MRVGQYLIGCALAGFHHRKMRFVRGVSYVWGAGWFVLEPAALYLEWLDAIVTRFGPQILIGTLSMGLLNGIALMFSPPRVRFCIKTTDTKICVGFGDLFASGNQLVIPVNEFFDSEIGLPVSPNSIHGKFIEQIYIGDQKRFERQVDRSLAGKHATPMTRPVGRQLAFPIGTTAVVSEGRQTFYVVALARTNLTTCKAKAEVEDLWKALGGLWSSVRSNAGGDTVSVPLMGSGLSGVGIDPSHLIRLILLSILIETRRGKITSEISIVLHPRLMGEVDLEAVKRDWS